MRRNRCGQGNTAVRVRVRSHMLCHSLRAEKRSGRVHFERLAPLGFGYFESRNTADDSCKAEEVVDGAESLDGGVKAFLHALAGGYVDGYAEDAGGGEVGGEGGDCGERGAERAFEVPEADPGGPVFQQSASTGEAEGSSAAGY
jgi:hypothetical protein